MKRRGIYKLMFSEKNEMGIDGKGHAKIEEAEKLLPSSAFAIFCRPKVFYPSVL